MRSHQKGQLPSADSRQPVYDHRRRIWRTDPLISMQLRGNIQQTVGQEKEQTKKEWDATLSLFDLVLF